jgi:hypothetical protein
LLPASASRSTGSLSSTKSPWDHYYLQRAIGGPGAFVLPADDFEDFARAIRMKLIREIEGTMVASVTP